VFGKEFFFGGGIQSEEPGLCAYVCVCMKMYVYVCMHVSVAACIFVWT
jgi:hypothetical protein